MDLQTVGYVVKKDHFNWIKHNEINSVNEMNNICHKYFHLSFYFTLITKLNKLVKSNSFNLLNLRVEMAAFCIWNPVFAQNH